MSAYAKYKLFLYVLLTAGIISLFGFTFYIFSSRVPDKIVLKEDNESVIDLKLPLTGEINSKSVNGDYVSSVNFNYPVSIATGEPASYDISLKLFGLIHYKDITLNVVEQKYLYAGGLPVGVYLKSDGVLVIDNARFTTIDGKNVSPCENIIKKGDYICRVNGSPVNTKIELIECVSNCGGQDLIIGIKRGNSTFDVKVTPMQDTLGDYKIGVWIRDDTQGIGTLTFIDEEGNFGALGHGISDIDTGEIFNVHDGILYRASILTIVRGQAGSPGEYVGTIDYSSKNQLGLINKNSSCGVFGVVNSNHELFNKMKKYEIGYKYDMKVGKAYIISGTDENVKLYEIRIDALDYNTANINKGIEFTVTDEKLLSITNGIIQGMSGSPIIQDNKIVGAVTHVFVNDSTRGYGIFIENMLDEIQ